MREREGEQTQTLILTFSFFVVFPTRACPLVTPSWLRIWAPTAAFTSSRLVPSWYFSSFLSCVHFPKGLCRLSFFQQIRTRRRFAADTFLFLTRASTAITTNAFLFVSHLYPFSLLVSLLAFVLFLISVSLFSNTLWSTIKTINWSYFTTWKTIGLLRGWCFSVNRWQEILCGEARLRTPSLNWNPEAETEVRCWPKGETQFLREFWRALRKLPWSNNHSRPKKQRYKVLEGGVISDPLEKRLVCRWYSLSRELGSRKGLFE